jgi:hypothetical protein
MSIFNDKINKSVADAVTKIIQQEATHPKTEKEKQLAAMGHPKDKITHKDVLIGRGVLKKEEKELSPKQKQIAKMSEPEHKIDAGDLAKLRAGHKPVKEEKESCEDEAEEAVDKHEKKMHGKKGEVAKHEKEMHKEEYLFTSLIESYKKDGLKSLSKMRKEEVDSETYEKEMKDQKDKFDGKKKGGDVAKASVQAVKQEETHTEIQVIDMTDANNIKKKTIDITEAKKMKGEDPCWKDYEMVGHKMKNGKKVPNCVPKNEEVEQVEERTLTEPEEKKKEEIVMSMKKKLSGFKDRYGERGKSVLYATATRIAKEKA